MRRVTGAVVLMGVAVCAVTGCVSVRGEAAPDRSADPGPSRSAAVPPDGEAAEDAEPRRDRPQLREAPSRPLPRRSAGGEAGDAGAPSASPAVGVAPTSAGGGDPAAAPPGGPGRPAPVVRSPAVPELPGGPQMCDLGRRYGGWAEGSMPEEACEQAYAG